MAVERVLSNLNLISFKTEGGLQNHIDELQDGDLVFTPDNSLKGNLFDFKWTDHKLNDISWLNADTFSWQSGDVYEAAYNHLAEDCKVYAWQYAPTQGGDIGYTTTETPAVGGVLMIGGNACNITEVGSDYVVAEHYKTGEARTYQRVADSDSTAFVAGVLSTDTVDDITVTFYRAEDGHKICLADQEANVQRLYDWMGVAWYYVLDTANKQFKLPRTKYAFTGLRDSVGGYVKAGLPNITGIFYGQQAALTSGSGAFFTGNNPYGGTVAAGSANNAMRFDASRSSSVYGNSNTVQPEATQMYLYFYVGNFEREAIEQTAGITSEQLNNKADVSDVVELQNKTVELQNKTVELQNKTSRVVIESQEPATASNCAWYRKYSDGWVEQGGNTQTGKVVLPVPMANTNYVTMITTLYNNSSNPAYKEIGVLSEKTTTGFTKAGDSKAYNWFVCGKAA